MNRRPVLENTDAGLAPQMLSVLTLKRARARTRRLSGDDERLRWAGASGSKSYEIQFEPHRLNDLEVTFVHIARDIK